MEQDTNMHTPQEATPQEATSQEATPQEAMPQEAMPQEAIPQEATPQEAMPQNVVAVGKTFPTLILEFATEVVGEESVGDLTPTLIEDAIRALSIEIRDQSNGRLLTPALDDMGSFLRQCMAAGAAVHLPQPGDIIIMQYKVSRLYWSAIVETVGATDLGVLISLPPGEDLETKFDRQVIKRRGLNDAWHTVGFIRL